MPVDGAPVLGSNPYVGAAASAGSAAASLAGALQAAASQHDRLMALQQQQQAQAVTEESNRRSDFLAKGAIPAPYDIQRDPKTGLVTRTLKFAPGQDPNRMVVFPHLSKDGSQDLYMPTPEELEENKQKVVDQHEGARSIALTKEKADEARQNGFEAAPDIPYSPGIIGELNAASRDAQAGHMVDPDHFTAEGKPVPVLIDKDKGTYRALTQELGDASGAGPAQNGTDAYGNWIPSLGPGAQSEQSAPPLEFGRKPAAPKAPKSLHFQESTNNAGDVTTTARDPESGKVVSEDTRKGIGPTRKDPDAEPKPKGLSAPQVRPITKTKQDAIDKALKQYRQDIAGIELLEGPDRRGSLPDQRAEAAANLKAGYQAAQNKYEELIGASTGRPVEHNPWADNYGQSGQSGQNAGATPQKTAPPPAQTQAKTPKYKASDITAWAKAHGKDPADALKRAKSKGLI